VLLRLWRIAFGKSCEIFQQLIIKITVYSLNERSLAIKFFFWQDDLERLVAEAKVKTSALLLKKLQDRLRSVMNLNLSPELLEEAYEAMEDLKERVDKVNGNVTSSIGV